jgi:hypothetical protein
LWTMRLQSHNIGKLAHMHVHASDTSYFGEENKTKREYSERARTVLLGAGGNFVGKRAMLQV